MSLWLRTRRAGWLVLAVALVVMVGIRVRGRTVEVPNAFGLDSGDLLIASLLPIIWASAVADVWSSTRQSVECRPSNRLSRLDAVLLVVASVAASGAFSLVLGSSGSRLAGVGAMLIGSGMSATLTVRRGPGAAVLSVALLMLFTVSYSVTAPWARYLRVFQADGDLVWSLACGLTATSVAAVVLGTHRVSHQAGRDESSE